MRMAHPQPHYHAAAGWTAGGPCNGHVLLVHGCAWVAAAAAWAMGQLSDGDGGEL